MRKQSDKTEIWLVFNIKVNSGGKLSRTYLMPCRSLWGVNWHHFEKPAEMQDKLVPHVQETSKLYFLLLD